jgi:hypothetical protein
VPGPAFGEKRVWDQRPDACCHGRMLHRPQLRSMGVDACCVADHPLDRFGRGDIYLMVPPEQWSQASEIVDNIE